MTTTPCPFCGGAIENDTCPSCGRNPTQPRKVCPKCGRMTLQNEGMCCHCQALFGSELSWKVPLIVALFIIAFIVSIILHVAAY